MRTIEHPIHRKPFQGILVGALLKVMRKGNTRKPVKVTLPWELYISIIQLQGGEGLTWDEACIHASKLLDTSKGQYAKEVEKEALRIFKSRHMTEMNKSKKKWVDDAYQKGVDENRICYPCCICGGDLVMKPGEKDHEAMKELMRKSGWHHSTCN